MDGTGVNGSERVYGIDVLRCFAAFAVIMVHCTSPNSLCSDFPPGGWLEFVMHYFWLLSLCAVNCFGLITGYLGGNHKLRLAAWATLYLQVLFYLVIVYVLINSGCCGKDTRMFLRTILPVNGGVYWYFAAYTLVAVLSPLLQRVTEFSKRDFQMLVLGLLLLYVVPGVFPWGPVYGLGGAYGHSAIWLVVLYLTGAYVRRFPISWLTARKCLFGALLCPLLGCLAYQGFSQCGGIIKQLFCVALYDFRAGEYSVMYYSHPLIFMEALLLLLAASKIKINHCGSWFRAIAPYAFGVYLVHCNILFSKICKDPLLLWARSVPKIFYPVAFLTVIGGMFFLCIGIDFLRAELFRLLRIRVLLNACNKKLLPEDD